MGSSDEYDSSSCEEDDAIRSAFNENEEINYSLLPNKSNLKNYLFAYDEFVQWMKSNKLAELSEETFLMYMNEFKNSRAGTVRSRYCLLKKVVSIKYNINIDSFESVKQWVRKKCKNHRPGISKAFTLEQINNFLEEAPDNVHLPTKVILIFGITGALRACEFPKIKFSDVEDRDDHFIVNIIDTKTHYPRSFIIKEQFYEAVANYAVLRPRDISTPRFFIDYSNRKCNCGLMSKKKFYTTPQIIAEYLKLPDVELYTGHSYRRTAIALREAKASRSRQNDNDQIETTVPEVPSKFTRATPTSKRRQCQRKVSEIAEEANSSTSATTTAAGSANVTSDENLVLTKNRWKGLRDVFRAELKRELFAERMNMPRKRRGRWMPYNHMSFLQSQMSVIAEDDNITKKSKVKTEIEDPSFVEVYESEDPLANFVEEAQDVNHPSSLISESLSEEQSLSLTGEDSNQEQQQQQQSNQPDINNHYDDNYHFLVSLAPHMKKLSDERQMLLRMKMQELVYKEVYKKE